jgi:hypothetical protein
MLQKISYTLALKFLKYCPEKSLVPDWGEIVDSAIGLLYQATYAGGPVRQLFAIVDYIPQFLCIMYS